MRGEEEEKQKKRCVPAEEVERATGRRSRNKRITWRLQTRHKFARAQQVHFRVANSRRWRGASVTPEQTRKEDASGVRGGRGQPRLEEAELLEGGACKLVALNSPLHFPSPLSSRVFLFSFPVLSSCAAPRGLRAGRSKTAASKHTTVENSTNTQITQPGREKIGGKFKEQEGMPNYYAVMPFFSLYRVWLWRTVVPKNLAVAVQLARARPCVPSLAHANTHDAGKTAEGEDTQRKEAHTHTSKRASVRRAGARSVGCECRSARWPQFGRSRRLLACLPARAQEARNVRPEESTRKSLPAPSPRQVACVAAFAFRRFTSGGCHCARVQRPKQNRLKLHAVTWEEHVWEQSVD
jgi:hypothetical protein